MAPAILRATEQRESCWALEIDDDLGRHAGNRYIPHLSYRRTGVALTESKLCRSGFGANSASPMHFLETNLPGAFEIRLQLQEDLRGFFARSWCQKEFEEHGLNPSLAQCSISFNTRKGTLRGIHFQGSPRAEAKLVRCTRGSIYDVVVDLRQSSPTFRKWIAVELTSENRAMLYVPEGCGHGFLTLEDKTEVFYQMSEFFCPEAGRGVRWNDPAFDIAWPEQVQVISERDAAYPDFK